MIDTIENQQEAVNPMMISNIAMFDDPRGSYVGIFMNGGHLIRTQFTNIDSAIDYIQRAPSISLEGA